jgi:hypothetical protein
MKPGGPASSGTVAERGDLLVRILGHYGRFLAITMRWIWLVPS